MTSLLSRPRARALAALLATAALLGCDGTAITEVGPSVATVIANVGTTNGIVGVYNEGTMPQAGGGAVFSVSTVPAAVVGGSALYTLSSTTPFTEALVTIEGYEGYFDVDLPTATTNVDLLVTFRQEQLYFTHNLLLNGTAAGGGVGSPAFVSTRLISVGTGDVQVSVFFDALSDVDLHVIDPNGDRIYFGDPTAESGGTLDLDANAACTIDNPVVNNENITFPTGTAPRGTYRVEVNYWSACNVARTRYVVTVVAKDQPLRVFTGTFTGNVAGTTHQVVTFTY